MTTKENVTSKVLEILDKKDTTMLVTHDEQKGLVSRPMTVQQTEADGDVWFFVSSDADVIDEIKANGDVNIAYVGEEGYISLSGEATISEDDEKKKKLWYPELKHWFDGDVGPESEQVKLIQVKVTSSRHWDADRQDQS